MEGGVVSFMIWEWEHDLLKNGLSMDIERQDVRIL